jgi:hypothetical protein
MSVYLLYQHGLIVDSLVWWAINISPILPLKSLVPRILVQTGYIRRSDTQQNCSRRSSGNPKKKARLGAGLFLVKLWYLTTQLYTCTG